MDSNRNFENFYKNKTILEPYDGFLIKNIEDVKFPIKKGEYYNVPCIIEYILNEKHITPIINLLHNDKENGQDYFHYHADTRFIYINKSSISNFTVMIKRKIYPCANIRLTYTKDIVIERIILMARNENEIEFTPSIFITNSKLKHKCIHKGKCPHRGMDLTQIKASEDGIIRCPLHGLEFDSKTKQIINR